MKKNAREREAEQIEPKLSPLVRAFAKDPRVSYGGKGFGSGALKVDGKIFAMISSQGLFVVKLPKDRVSELVREESSELRVGHRAVDDRLVDEEQPRRVRR